MNIIFLEPARLELDEAYQYYASKDISVGAEFLDEIFYALQNISNYPSAWPKFSKHTRRCLISTFPYSVIYRKYDNKIIVVAIAHLHRKPEYWKNRI